MVALACLPVIFPKVRIDILLWFSIVLPVFSSVTLYWLYPEVQWYAGFSGVLHGLYVVAAVLSYRLKGERLFAIGILLGILLKLSWESVTGGLSATEQLIGSPVLIEAHQMGVFWGIVLLLCSWVWSRR